MLLYYLVLALQGKGVHIIVMYHAEEWDRKYCITVTSHLPRFDSGMTNYCNELNGRNRPQRATNWPQWTPTNHSARHFPSLRMEKWASLRLFSVRHGQKRRLTKKQIIWHYFPSTMDVWRLWLMENDRLIFWYNTQLYTCIWVMWHYVWDYILKSLYCIALSVIFVVVCLSFT